MSSRSRSLTIALALATLLPAAAFAEGGSGTPEDMKACKARQPELLRRAEAFKGDPMMKKLIDADLRRASREEGEGDGDECVEALDHADKLLRGDV